MAHTTNPVSRVFGVSWSIFSPAVFGLIVNTRVPVGHLRLEAHRFEVPRVVLVDEEWENIKVHLHGQRRCFQQGDCGLILERGVSKRFFLHWWSL